MINFILLSGVEITGLPDIAMKVVELSIHEKLDYIKKVLEDLQDGPKTNR